VRVTLSERLRTRIGTAAAGEDSSAPFEVVVGVVEAPPSTPLPPLDSWRSGGGSGVARGESGGARPRLADREWSLREGRADVDGGGVPRGSSSGGAKRGGEGEGPAGATAEADVGAAAATAEGSGGVSPVPCSCRGAGPPPLALLLLLRLAEYSATSASPPVTPDAAATPRAVRCSSAYRSLDTDCGSGGGSMTGGGTATCTRTRPLCRAKEGGSKNM
jgi:hypothetical protein